MNSKLINTILTRKHNDFLKHIDDEEIKSLIDKNAIITGGAITSLLLNEDVNDFDYYFTNKEAVVKIANYFVKKFQEKTPNLSDKVKIYVEESEDRVKVIVKSVGIAKEGENNQNYQYFEQLPEEVGSNFVDSVTNTLNHVNANKGRSEKYRPVFMTSNAITLSEGVQLVLRFYGSPEEIHKNYDFVHCTNYWVSSEKKLYLNQPALEAILSKQLYYTGSLYPIASVIRTRKFIKRGWHINAGQYLKMCFQVGELDLKNIAVLEDQLTGVDAAYFQQIIDWLKAEKEKDATFEIKVPYLISIIDKIF
jgi:hypothetical protein